MKSKIMFLGEWYMEYVIQFLKIFYKSEFILKYKQKYISVINQIEKYKLSSTTLHKFEGTSFTLYSI